MAVGDVEIDQLVSAGLGDTSGGNRLTGQITASGVMLPFTSTFQFVRVDRALIGIYVTAIGPDEPTVDRAALLQVLVDAVSDQST